MRGKQVTFRHAAPSKVPHPPRHLWPPNPTTEDIMKALDEVKANQQKIQDEYNRLKAHVLLIDECCIDSYLGLQLDLGADPSDWGIEADHYNHLPQL
jgi:hypothetical protein